MTQPLLLTTRRLQTARSHNEVVEALTDARRAYGLSVQSNDEGDPYTSDTSEGQRGNLTQLLVSFLPPMGEFPEALLDLVYDRDDIQLASDVLRLADGFFLDVHPIFSIGSLVPLLSRSHRGRLAQTHIWRLLKVIMVDRSDTWKQCWDAVIWREAFPEREWEDVCLTLVGWWVTIAEVETQWKMDDLRLECFLSQWLCPLLDGLLSIDDGMVEKMAVLFGVFLRRCLNRGLGTQLMDALLNQCQLRFDRLEDFALLSKGLHHVCDPYALEKFFDCLLSSLSQNTMDAIPVLRALYLKADGKPLQDEMAYVLFHRILMKRQLPKRMAKWLIDLLVESGDKMKEIVRQLAKTWSDKDAIDHMALPIQAYRTYLLTLLIPHLSGNLGGNDRMTRWLLNGVTNRLENSLESIRFQGMRVAHTIAAQQPNADPLFHEMDADFQSLQAEEQWDHTDTAPTSTAVWTKTVKTNERTPDSDDDSDVSSLEDHDLEPLVKEDTSASIIKKDHRPMTLMDIHRDLQDTEEPMKTIAAIKCLPVLLKEHPSELPSMAAAMSRTLVHVALPDWISEEMLKDDAGEMKGLSSSTAVRVHCLSLLLMEAPLHCGGHVATMVASKQLAEYQRLESLEALRQAAIQLSRPPPQTSGVSASGVCHLDSAKTRRWGVRSLERHQRSVDTWRNRFVDVVGLWLSSLLFACQPRQEGFDIMKRHPVVLSGVLITLGTFADCVSNSIAATSVALTSFPLIRAALEKSDSNVHLKRCGFRALASLIGSIPIGRLSTVVDFPLSFKTDSTDAALREMLVWIKEQTSAAVVGDSDESCRGLAAHTLHLYTQISQSALECSTPSTTVLPKRPSIKFRIPSMSDIARLK